VPAVFSAAGSGRGPYAADRLRTAGGDRSRPVLAQTLARLRPGDTLDRLARSLSHLLEVIEALQGRGVFFRSLKDPVDTASPQGLFTLQVLGAAAQLERAHPGADEERHARGDRVELRGFGAFVVKHRETRIGRNSRTGASVAVHEKSVPFVKPKFNSLAGKV